MTAGAAIVEAASASEWLRAGDATGRAAARRRGSAAAEEAADRISAAHAPWREAGPATAPPDEAARAAPQRSPAASAPATGSGRSRRRRRSSPACRTREIGVQLESSLLMVPRKSVSFAMWLGADARPLAGLSGCARCELESCRYRRVRGPRRSVTRRASRSLGRGPRRRCVTRPAASSSASACGSRTRTAAELLLEAGAERRAAAGSCSPSALVRAALAHRTARVRALTTAPARRRSSSASGRTASTPARPRSTASTRRARTGAGGRVRRHRRRRRARAPGRRPAELRRAVDRTRARRRSGRDRRPLAALPGAHATARKPVVTGTFSQGRLRADARHARGRARRRARAARAAAGALRLLPDLAPDSGAT